MTELLKQGQYSPMKVGEEVLVLYAGTHGYLDTVEVSDVLEYEKQLLAFARAERPEVLDTLNTVNELTQEVEEKVVSALEAFKTVFKPAQQEK